MAAGRAVAFQAPGLGSAILISTVNLLTMVGSHRNKEQQRFYLLPGMGGRAYRRKQKLILKWSIITGILASGVLAVLLYLMSKR